MLAYADNLMNVGNDLDRQRRYASVDRPLTQRVGIKP